MEEKLIIELTIFCVSFLSILFAVVFVSIRNHDEVASDDLVFFGFFINFCISMLISMAQLYLIIPIVLGFFLWGFISLTVFIARKTKMWDKRND